jgi:catechol 2,3-dioxygenase-like lactoylglutathione lyase family enzyme
LRFYEAALKPLGHVVCQKDESGASLGPAGEPLLYLYRMTDSAPPGTHLAFRAGDRKIVDRFHAAGLACGGRDHGAPGVREDYSPRYYAAFLLDPDGNNVEVVCTR